MVIRKDELVETFRKAIPLLKKERREIGSFIKIETGKVIFVGDLHGNLENLKAILKKTNFRKRIRSEDIHLVFLGDYVDRGENSIEVLRMVLNLKIDFPEKVVLLRGNHEVEEVNEIYGFKRELIEKYGEKWKEIYKYCKEIYGLLPYCVKTANGIFAVHGGVPVGIDVDKNKLKNPPKGLAEQLIWNDFGEKDEPNLARGIGYVFGKKTMEKFLKKFGCKVLLRAHIRVSGYRLFLDHGITLFSAKPNLPAYLEIDIEEEVSINEIEKRIKESISP